MRQPHSFLPDRLRHQTGRRHTAPLLLAPLLLAGLMLAGPEQAAARPGDAIGEWAGTLVTAQGTCPDRAPSRLLVDENAISFVPAGGVLVLHGQTQRGQIGPGQPHLHAQLLLSDMNHKPLPMVFEGILRADGSAIDGTYGTPTCRAHVTLLRPVNHPLQRALGN